jgi:hypothetical protein
VDGSLRDWTAELAHQMIDLKNDDAAVFDSIIVVTDRRILDRQIRDTIRHFAQVGATVGRCIVHFAVDDQEVRFCTKLDGKGSWFLPFRNAPRTPRDRP